MAHSLVAAGLCLVPLSASAARLTIDPLRTRIAFSIDAAGYPQMYGVFHKFDGRIEVDFERPERSHVAFSVEFDSSMSARRDLSDYVKSQGWLERGASSDDRFRLASSEQDRRAHGAGRWRSDAARRDAPARGGRHRATRSSGSRLGFLAHTSINRLEYGMNAAFPVVARDVQLDIFDGKRLAP